ncbi:F-box domain containing protein [Tanacetum coccineum]
MKENTIDTTDRFTLLPDFIIHHILSYLLDDPKSRVRMSVLSKRWFTLTASFPILNFRQDWHWVCSFSRKFDDEYIKEKFYKYVEHTVSRFCEQNISAHTLNISAEIINLEQRELFGRCLDSVLEKGLQMMQIQFVYHPGNLPLLRLPNTLLSASSLTSLTLHKCELPSSLMDDDVKFKSLRLLSLSHIPIDEGVIEYLTKGCPILEEIYLRYCSGFKTFCVKRHQNLLKVDIYCHSRFLLERIDVDAPNLIYFLLQSNNYKDESPSILYRKHSSMSKGYMNCVARDSFDILWYRKLRKFLEKNSIFKVLKLDINLKLRDVEELKLIQSPPCELEHVELINSFNESGLLVPVAVVDAVLWCCRPRSLTLELYHYMDTGHIVKYTYNKLLRQENEDQTNIKFVLFTSSEDTQHFSDLKSMLKRLSFDHTKSKRNFDGRKSKITFIKEEVVQEAGSVGLRNVSCDHRSANGDQYY